MTYARLISETEIDRDAPRWAAIGDRIVVGDLPADYLASLGYYPLQETPAPTPREGWHVEPRYAYDDAGHPAAVVQSWVEVEVENPPPPPVDYSKRALYRVFKERGVWPTVKAWMEAQGVWEDWEYATTLQSDDPLISAAKTAIQALMGLTDEEMEAILAGCEV